jgi:hypothetical protein
VAQDTGVARSHFAALLDSRGETCLAAGPERLLLVRLEPEVQAPSIASRSLFHRNQMENSWLEKHLSMESYGTRR